MPRNGASPDPATLLACLDSEDAAAVVRMLDGLGLDPHELPAVPGLLATVETLAVLRVMEDTGDVSRSEAFDVAADAVGLNGSTIMKRYTRWHERAWTLCPKGSGGQ